MKKAVRKRESALMRSRKKWSFLFTLPWLIGAITFFVVPMVQSAVYTFCDVTLTAQGESFRPVGFENFFQLFSDPNFVLNLQSSVLTTIYQVPVIVLFALFSAILLRDQFPGRTLVRAIFFFPVMISSGVVITILQQNLMMNGNTTDQQQAYLFAAPSFVYFIEQLGIPQFILDVVQKVLSSFFNILWKSGVQIILLLAAVNHIPSSAYEAADIEGATAWEKLWKITFPMIAPNLLVVLIYSLIDSFTDYGNLVMVMIRNYFSLGQYEYCTTVGMIYYVIVLAIVGLVNFVVGKRIQYTVDN